MPAAAAEKLAPLLLPLVGEDQDTVDYIIASLSEEGIGRVIVLVFFHYKPTTNSHPEYDSISRPGFV